MEMGAHQGKFFKYDKQLIGIESSPRGRLIYFDDSIPTRLSFTKTSMNACYNHISLVP